MASLTSIVKMTVVLFKIRLLLFVTTFLNKMNKLNIILIFLIVIANKIKRTNSINIYKRKVVKRNSKLKKPE